MSPGQGLSLRFPFKPRRTLLLSLCLVASRKEKESPEQRAIHFFAWVDGRTKVWGSLDVPKSPEISRGVREEVILIKQEKKTPLYFYGDILLP